MLKQINGTAQRPQQVAPQGVPLGLGFRSITPGSLGPEECEARIKHACDELRGQFASQGTDPRVIEHRINKMARRFRKKFSKR